MPIPSRMNGARASPYMRASRSTSAAGTPVIAATAAGAPQAMTRSLSTTRSGSASAAGPTV